MASARAARASPGSAPSATSRTPSRSASSSCAFSIIGGRVIGARRIYPTPRSPSTGMPEAISVAISRQIVRTDTSSRAAISAARCNRPSRRIWIKSKRRSVRRMAAVGPAPHHWSSHLTQHLMMRQDHAGRINHRHEIRKGRIGHQRSCGSGGAVPVFPMYEVAPAPLRMADRSGPIAGHLPQGSLARLCRGHNGLVF